MKATLFTQQDLLNVLYVANNNYVHNTAFIDLCSGVGAGRLGLQLEGFNCLGYSEINQQSVATYKKLHGSAENNLGDLTKLNYSGVPNCQMLIAGFPCQPFSIVGKRQGLQDQRGQIIFFISQILQQKNIKYFILENVKGLVNLNSGQVLKDILDLLSKAGYYVYYSVLNSYNYGVPQLRERVYFVGIKKTLKHNIYNFPTATKYNYNLSNYLIDDNTDYILQINSVKYNTFVKYLNNKYNKNKYNLSQILKQELVILDTRQSDLRIYTNKIPTLRTGRHGILYVKNGSLRYLSGKEAFLLQGFSYNYVNNLSNISNTALLSQAGNAMTVNVIQAIAKNLIPIIIANNNEKD